MAAKRTPAQIEASRRNGARSPGRPRKTVILEHLPRGLSAGITLLPSEQPENFQNVLNALLARHQPQDDAEALCVEEMANALWRLRRCWAHQKAMLLRESVKSLEAEVAVYQKLLQQGTLQHYWREENRLRRGFAHSFQHLSALRLDKCPPPDQANPENIVIPENPAPPPSAPLTHGESIACEASPLQGNLAENPAGNPPPPPAVPSSPAPRPERPPLGLPGQSHSIPDYLRIRKEAA